MMALGCLVILMVLSINGAFCGRINDEYSVGTNLNKFLWAPKEGDDNVGKRADGEKQTTAVWFGPRFGKRSSSLMENLPAEIIEILQKVQKSPELQGILAEKLQMDNQTPFVVYLPNSHPESSHFMMPRYLRDAPDSTQSMNSRPYPPRFGRSFGGLPPYLPRLGRSSSDAE